MHQENTMAIIILSHSDHYLPFIIVGNATRSATARMLGLRVRVPLGASISLLNVVCSQEEVSATGRSLVQRSPTECGVSDCDDV